MVLLKIAMEAFLVVDARKHQKQMCSEEEIYHLLCIKCRFNYTSKKYEENGVLLLNFLSFVTKRFSFADQHIEPIILLLLISLLPTPRYFQIQLPSSQAIHYILSEFRNIVIIWRVLEFLLPTLVIEESLVQAQVSW